MKKKIKLSKKIKIRCKVPKELLLKEIEDVEELIFYDNPYLTDEEITNEEKVNGWV